MMDQSTSSDPMSPYGNDSASILQGMSAVIQHLDEKLTEVLKYNDKLEYDAQQAIKNHDKIKRHLADCQRHLLEEGSFYALWTSADTKASLRGVEIDSLNRLIKKQELKIQSLENPRFLRSSVKKQKRIVKYAKRSGIILKCPVPNCAFTGFSDQIHKHLMAKKLGHEMTREEKKKFIEKIGGLKSV